MNSLVVAVSSFSRSRAACWAMTVAWAMLVFYLSTARFRPDFSERLVGEALTFLHVSFSLRTVHALDALLRKSAHVLEYGILAVLLYGSLANERPFRWRLGRALWCVFIAGAYSLTDEFHQMFVPGRHASLMDCGVDAAGAAIAVAIVYQGQRWFRGIRREDAETGPGSTARWSVRGGNENVP